MTHLRKCVSFSLILISLMGFVMVPAVFMVGVARGEDVVDPLLGEPAEEALMVIEVLNDATAVEETFYLLHSGGSFRLREAADSLAELPDVEYRDVSGNITKTALPADGIWREQALSPDQIRAEIKVVQTNTEAYLEGIDRKAYIHIRQGKEKALGQEAALKPLEGDLERIARIPKTHPPADSISDGREGDLVEIIVGDKGLLMAIKAITGHGAIVEWIEGEGKMQAVAEIGKVFMIHAGTIPIRVMAREHILLPGAVKRIAMGFGPYALATLPSNASAKAGRIVIEPGNPGLWKGHPPYIISEGEKVSMTARSIRMEGPVEGVPFLRKVVWYGHGWPKGEPAGLGQAFGAFCENATVIGLLKDCGYIISSYMTEKGFTLAHAVPMRVNLSPSLQDVPGAHKGTRYNRPDAVALEITDVNNTAKTVGMKLFGPGDVLLAEHAGLPFGERFYYHGTDPDGRDAVVVEVGAINAVLDYYIPGSIKDVAALKIPVDFEKERIVKALGLEITPILKLGRLTVATVAVRDADGDIMPVAPGDVLFASSVPAVADVDPTGIITGRTKGSTVIMARYAASSTVPEVQANLTVR